MEPASAFEESRQALQLALNDNTNKVVALTGAWGTGKTHLWQQFDTSKVTKKTLTVSAFGLTSILDLKKRLIQAVSATDKKLVDGFLNGSASAAKGAANKFLGISLDDIALLGLPKLLSSRIIAIDDIERKNKSFDINELLGFINEYSEKHSARFLLLLNTDKIEDNETWQKLHEKVIDTEIILTPSPKEAFEIASSGETASHLKSTKKTIIDLEITNIRIIKRVLKTISKVLTEHPGLNPKIYNNIMPSMVLLSAAHYGGVKNGLTLDYLIKYSQNGVNDSPSAQQTEWITTINAIKFSRDQFVSIVIAYLKTGSINQNEIRKYLEPRKKNLKKNLDNETIEKFLTDHKWDPAFSQETAKKFHEFLEPIVYEVEAANISSISKCFEETGLPNIAKSLIDKWIENLELDPDGAHRLQYFESGRLHPRLIEAKEHLTQPLREPLCLEQAILNIRSKGVSDTEEHSLERSTIEQYKRIIETLSGDKLRDFVEFHFRGIRTSKHRALRYASANFDNACHAVFKANSQSRLSMILKREFDARELDIQSPATFKETLMEE